MKLRSHAAGALCAAVPFLFSCTSGEIISHEPPAGAAGTQGGSGILTGSGGVGTKGAGGSSGTAGPTGGSPAVSGQGGAAGSASGATGTGAAGTVGGGSAGTTGGVGGSGARGPISGSAGTTGSAGTPGRAGTTGSGAAGTPGATGTAGAVGTAGAPGSSGTTGTAGRVGSAGASGRGGATGGAGVVTGTGGSGRAGSSGGSSGAGGLGGATGAAGSAGAAGSSIATALPGTIVPLYTDPTDSSWTAIVEAKQAHPKVPVVAIVNPADGPGSARSSAYTNGIAKLQAANIKVIGYVATGYAANSLASVESKIDQWKSFYPTLQGIFFDEQSNQAGDVDYYRTLSQYAKSHGLAYTVGNPGTDTAEAFVGALDTMLIYESDGVPTTSQMGGWHTKYAASNFGVIPYATPFNAAFVATARKYVGYIYLQNDDLPNPWDSLPSYFAQLLAALE